MKNTVVNEMVYRTQQFHC